MFCRCAAFTGPIPEALGALSELEELGLNVNELTGDKRDNWRLCPAHAISLTLQKKSSESRTPWLKPFDSVINDKESGQFELMIL